MTKRTIEWHVRAAASDGDRRYVVQTWRSSLLSIPPFRTLARGEVRRGVDRPIDAILARPDTVVLVAAPTPTDLETIGGWLVFTPIPHAWTLHYLYVRTSGGARGTGCARALARSAGIDVLPRVFYTFRGPSADALLARNTGALPIPVERFLERYES